MVIGLLVGAARRRRHLSSLTIRPGHNSAPRWLFVRFD
jgi:hypothetical protein